MLLPAVSFSTWLTVSSTLFAAVAAIATILAVYFSRETVNDSRAASKEAWARHREQLEELRKATEASAEQHRVEMDERRAVASVEKLEKQLRQIAAVIEQVLEIGNAARAEATLDPNASVAGYSQIPPMLIALEGSLLVLQALDLPEVPKTAEFVRVGRHAGMALSGIASMSVDALLELQQLPLSVARSDQA